MKIFFRVLVVAAVIVSTFAWVATYDALRTAAAERAGIKAELKALSDARVSDLEELKRRRSDNFEFRTRTTDRLEALEYGRPALSSGEPAWLKNRFADIYRQLAVLNRAHYDAKK